MINIPGQNRKYSIGNQSDLYGNIWYTKNINLDEEGYIKLSDRTVSIASEKDDSDMETPVAFGRTSATSTQSFNVVTSEDPFVVTVSPTSLTVAQDVDTGVPVGTLDSHGAWYRNLWHMTDDNDFFSKSGSTWTDRGNLTSGKAHPIEVFRSRDTICIGNGNVVSQFDNTYATSTNLTLPTDYEVVGLKYSNYQMGIITNLSDSAADQNQDAYFFVWDGSTTSASQGIPVGSDQVLGIVAYKGSWVILTRTGQLLFFTGGAFEEIASLPYYYQQLLIGRPGARDFYGDIMYVDGDVIYLNFTGTFNTHGTLAEISSQNNPGGILCYDPGMGIYHKYSYSITPASMVVVQNSGVDIATNILTKTSGDIPPTGNPIRHLNQATGPIGGLKPLTTYFVIKLSSTTFKLATTKENAMAGIAVDITSDGDTNNYFIALNIYDYGTYLANNVGGIAHVGSDNGVANSLIFGAELADFDSSDEWNHINLVVQGFENRGYFITSKMSARKVQEIFDMIVLKFRPLKDGDSIRMKYKTRDIVGLPVSTPQMNATKNQCTWSSPNSFYTTSDLSAAKTVFESGEPLECEIISGAGAGSMAKVTDISESSGTYVVVLDENIDGAAANRLCDIMIDNWTPLMTKDGQEAITSNDVLLWQELPIAKESSWFKFKCELRGTGTSTEELQFTNKEHR